MKTTILLVPTKKTDDVNWAKPINNYLLSIYGNTSEFQQDLASFNKLRQDIRGVNADLTGISLYFRYFSQLELLDLRIPVATVNKHKKLTFVWYDAFLPSAQHKQYALPFEKAGVLFNLASLMLKAAGIKYNESHSLSTDDSAFKDAVQYLQQAAGIFEFVGESFLHAPSNDLSPSTVKFLKDLCLAQSQEIFTLKVIDGDLEQKKNSLISKLCKSTATHYENCFSNCSHLLNADSTPEDRSTFAIVEAGLDDEDLEDVEDDPLDEYNPAKHGIPEARVTARIDSFWVAVLQVKALYYKSLSYYFHGLQLEASHKYGEAIAYLSKSLETINEVPLSSLKKISKGGNDNAYDLLDNLKYHKDALEIKIKELNKDNDLVYHEIVPSLVTLAEPRPMDSSKVIPLNKIELFAKINEQSYDNFLKNVVPMNIHELLSYYSEEKSQFLRNELDEVDVSNEELSSVLEYLKLPKALANIKEILLNNKSLSSDASSEQSLDPSVAQKVNEIALKYGQDTLNRQTISELRTNILAVVGESDAMLKDLFSESSSRFRDDLIKLKKALYDAANSDSKLFALVDAEKSLLHSHLSKGTSSREFQSLFAVPKNASQTQPSEEISLLDMDESQMKNMSHDGQIQALEDILHDLNVLRSNKNKLVDRLKEEIHNDDISEILMLNSKVKLTNEIKSIIFPEELKKFEVFSQQLDDLIKRQSSLISELKEKWTILSSNPKIKEVQTSKTFQDEVFKQQTQRINDFYDNHWKRYSLGLQRGSEYYMQLLKMAESLKSAIESDKSRSLSDSMNRMSLESNSTGGSHSSHQFFSTQRGDPQPQPVSPFAQYSPYNQGMPESQAQYTSFRQAPLQPSGTGGGPQPPQRHGSEFSSGSYYRPTPALPPKAPSFTSNNPSTDYSRNREPVMNQAKQQNSGGLIYDEPSTYQPDMYDFFKK